MRALILTVLTAGLVVGPLAACGEAQNPDAAPAGSEPQPEPPPGPVGPPVSSPLHYTGRWATTLEACKDAAWEVRADGLDTPGEVSCRWDPAKIRTVAPIGQEVEATCTAENPPQPASLAFYPQGPDTLEIRGAPFEAVPLVRCPGEG